MTDKPELLVPSKRAREAAARELNLTGRTLNAAQQSMVNDLAGKFARFEHDLTAEKVDREAVAELVYSWSPFLRHDDTMPSGEAEIVDWADAPEWHRGLAFERADAILALLPTQQEAEQIDGREGIARIVREQMKDQWEEICADTDCHPLDIKHGRGRIVWFEPNHWTEAVAQRVASEVLSIRKHEPAAQEQIAKSANCSTQQEGRSGLVEALELVRRSGGWASLSDETKAVVDQALSEYKRLSE